MDGEVKKKDVQEIDGIHIMIILGIVILTSLLHLSDTIQWFLLVGYALVMIFFHEKGNLKRSLVFVAIGFGLVLLKMVYMKLNI
ncbi:hypothetical protein PGH26_06670 [Sporosarcina jeotgali]|uniref:Uncharacterized protein n=1 Tax=Sporosarcina jeotgali TaxID=3020056 RepID=A0ABZ0KZI8_9BACL|nr:hypothetical protein [Sporosarcina sp. B2O-1]WOV85613.1 hypothetical protein PGH26_06670 [Sporosarcina sp. B2O-1]